MNKKLGQISIPIALALAGAGSIITGLSAYYGSQITQKAEVAVIRQDVAVLQAEKSAAEKNVLNLEKKVDQVDDKVERMDDKIDALLVNRGINPDQLPPSGISKNQ